MRATEVGAEESGGTSRWQQDGGNGDTNARCGGGPCEVLAPPRALGGPRQCHFDRIGYGVVDFDARVSDVVQPPARFLFETSDQQPAHAQAAWLREERSNRDRDSTIAASVSVSVSRPNAARPLNIS